MWGLMNVIGSAIHKHGETITVSSIFVGLPIAFLVFISWVAPPQWSLEIDSRQYQTVTEINRVAPSEVGNLIHESMADNKITRQEFDDINALIERTKAEPYKRELKGGHNE